MESGIHYQEYSTLTLGEFRHDTAHLSDDALIVVQRIGVDYAVHVYAATYLQYVRRQSEPGNAHNLISRVILEASARQDRIGSEWVESVEEHRE